MLRSVGLLKNTKAVQTRWFSSSKSLNALKNSEGEKIPSVVWPTIVDGKWVSLKSDDVFANKTVAVFSLPGAFTPTCSSKHLPRFNDLQPLLKKNGVDEIICMSVNDTFVMNAWWADQGADKVSLIADGNGEFTDKIGMLVDKSAIGFGKRSWRYSMLVKNGTIEKMFIEPEVEGDPFEVSDADTMLKYIAPNASVDAVTIITKPDCPFCEKAKTLLKSKEVFFEELVLGKDISSLGLEGLTNSSTVPQVFKSGKLIGGSKELEKVL